MRSRTHPDSHAELTSRRQRDNKRRHRARQKEYIADLERRVADTRERRVQVTKEVQLAAQKVARENARLKELLRRTGYTDDAIESWMKGEEEVRSCFVLPTKPVVQLRSAEEREPGFTTPRDDVQRATAPITQSTCKSIVSHQTPEDACSNTHVRPPSPPHYSKSAAAHPCKVLTLLAENPAADITQVQLSTDSYQHENTTDHKDGESSDGVECSTAYKMLMQYATSEEKMDRIAKALEDGCTPSAAGGCKFKTGSLWTALVEECT
ncbi:hypothetical protein E8E13_010155 [Curvularia kusanoi]|uniref:BZIP domain-containing protein n=1 Tax=Curvularia kusanoi TaxID=90978 RepID=A0A9P4TPF4_CURKU|nr:hypothetical protein E8E13_010155 [Curvularia kusanoi]